MWDKIASEWAGAGDCGERRRYQNAMDKIDFVTFALTNVQHSFMHRLPNWRDRETKLNKGPRKIGPLDSSIA